MTGGGEVGPILMGMGNRAHIVTPSITSRGLRNVGALAGAVTEVAGFLAERTDRALVPISVPAYFAYIMAMGALLVGGGWGALLRRPWGYVSLATYLVLHAGLFVNYQEVNPKLVGLAISMVAVGGLAWLRPPERLHPSSA